ncbi:MAG: SDR family NAD(P)-dependent oxidoreductase [Bacteroidetes bacterium]|nr:MAG: SDR family NAD(P)-dependent oxidoreductase [Bacteroidota bacterium]
MNIFITGGTGGIGSELARRYAKLGHRVGVCGGTQKNFEEVFGDLCERIEFWELDVTNRENTKEVLHNFSAKGNIDLLICCAGINNNKPHTDVNIDFDREVQILNVNLMGTFYALEGAIDVMKNQKHGHLVLLSSAAGLKGLPGAPAYCASKAALIALGESLGMRLKSYKIAVSVFAPGYINTPLARATVPNIEKKASTLSVEEAAEIMMKAIDKKVPFLIFPRSLAATSFLMKLIPNVFFNKFISYLYHRQLKHD